LQGQLEGVRGRSGREPTIDMKLMAWTEHIEAVRGKYKDGKKSLRKNIQRFDLVEEVLTKIGGMVANNMLRPLRINFLGESAVDEGACTREMFSQFFDQLFCKESLYFEGEHGDEGGGSGVRASYMPKAGLIERDPSSEDKLVAIGKVFMKALLTDDIFMAQCVPPAFFDYMIEPRDAVPADVYDAVNSLSFFDQQAAKTLSNMLQWAADEFDGLGMTVDDVDGSSSEEVLTSTNLAAAIRGKVGQVLVRSREPELSAIREGFKSAISGLHAHLDLFRGAELMGFMCGEARLTAAMLLMQMEFVDVTEQTELWVRRFVEEGEEKVLKQLLSLLVTGLSVMPSHGLRMQIKVQREYMEGRPLLRASACFFQLFVPVCGSYEQFHEKAMVSLSNGAVGFGLQ